MYFDHIIKPILLLRSTVITVRVLALVAQVDVASRIATRVGGKRSFNDSQNEL
jgi:hypothetical protein